jgi:thiol-disulfide isomerase/thioredoxin
MSHQKLDHTNRRQLADALRNDTWVVACLCAAWCGSCREYEAAFSAWAARAPQYHFVWIDIEDHADLLGDIDVDNFPTLLIERGATVAFFGPMEPDTRLAERILTAQVEKSDAELQREAVSSEQRRTWQQECSLLGKLADVI